ncbi:keratin, type II cytoskeletal 8-like isoform X1 [Embiotoca jacksoni]|uniref:keratin, type II cytoskeletal 8-like isoform X1 n=1 Tax=Embiotoca jacksoni TaxID=100190 RepID=UPI003704BBF3
MSKPRDYSSQSYTPGTAGPAKSQPSNKLDSSGKSRENDESFGLNDKFVQLIDKVKRLEDDNKKLDTKLKILKDQEDYEGKVDAIVKQLGNELDEQIETLLHDQDDLKDDLLKNQEDVEDTKKRYEDEMDKKAELENVFIVTKKDVDDGHMAAVELALELEDLMEKLSFLRVGYDEEIKELESHIHNETVIIRNNSKHSLDMDEIVETFKDQYARMATRTRNEAEQWNHIKTGATVLNTGQREQEVRDIKRDISDMLRFIQRLCGDLEALKRKEDSLKKSINDVRQEGEENMDKATEHIAQLEEALKRTKHDLAGQIRKQQELLHFKMALDIEIATYFKLLEGEEQKMSDLMRRTEVHLPPQQHLPEKPQAAKPAFVPATTIIPPFAKKRLLIRVEVEEGRVVSESSCYSD